MFLLAYGQSSAPALLFLALAFAALARGHRWLAGMAIGGLMYKPQLALGIAVVMLLAREWKIVGGALTSAAAGIAIGWWRVGTDVMRTYSRVFFDTPTLLNDLEPKLHHLHSLKGFFALLVPWPPVAFVAYAAASMVVLLIAWRLWTSPSPLGLRFAAVLLATVLIDPHLNVYDLVVLAPAFLLLADWVAGGDARADKSMARLIVASFVLPLIGPLAQWTHVQVSVVAMAWLLVAIARTPLAGGLRSTLR